MKRCFWHVVFAFLLIAPSSTLALAAQATTSLSGVVRDSSGGVVPGASVVVKDDATGRTFETVSNTSGTFSVPALGAGTYTVTVSLTGFKTFVSSNVRLASGTPGTVNATLEVGQLTDTITVKSSAELINTQTATVASTLNADQLNRMPTPTRNALNAVTFLPGVNTATTNRASTINGLPDSMVSITLDGVSNNDNYLRSSDAFFASVTPRQDAVEAVTVTMAAAGPQVGGSGAININFQTRSGSNRFSGSAYEYWRDPSLNTNYYFNKINNLGKNVVELNQYGARVGGPIVIPGLFDGRNKAFYFVNYEQVRFPNSFTRTRSSLHPRGLEGFMRYTVGGVLTEINVLDVARRNGQITAIDPTVMGILQKIQAATTGAVADGTAVVNPTNDLMINSFVWQSPGKLFEHQPTMRFDYNLTDKHRLSGSFSILFATRTPDYLNGADARFPGAPNSSLFSSRRPLESLTLRSTLASSLVNELRFGVTALGGQSRFGNDSSNGPQTFEDQGGFALNLDSNIGQTDWHVENGPTWRSAPTFSMDNTLSWQKASHSFSFGLSLLRATASASSKQVVPGIQIGFNNTFDPALSMFNTTNFPGASSGNLTDARELYGLLTGRVTSVSGQAVIDRTTNKYVAFGDLTREGAINSYALFAQDSWRTTPTLTITAGLRWDVQLPFSPANDIMSSVTMADICGMSGQGDGGTYSRCRFFSPGAGPDATVPKFQQLKSGTLGYSTDWNNISPSIGVAWRPNVQGGFLRAILGDPDQATIRAGLSRAYERQGMSDFIGVFSSNPGSSVSLTRSANSVPSIVLPGESWPVLLSQRSRLYPAPFPESPTFPIAIQAGRGSSLSAFAPDVQIGSAYTWTVSMARSITRDMAVEVRYVGTRGVDQWSEINYNSIRMENLVKNGFLNEFRLGMANLAANNAAGGSRLGSFAYFGPGTGTNPLPIFLAYLTGRTDATNAAAYTGGSTTWTNTDISSRFVASVPSATGAAGELDGTSSRRALALTAGLPANFFIPNPDVSSANVTDSGAFSDYHALQAELRRRLSRGLSASVNYQYALERGSAFDGFSFGRTMVSGGNVRHAIKTQWDWTLPVGRGQRFGSNMQPVLDAILGGWSINGVGRIQARTINFGNVRLVGMTMDELTKIYKYRFTTNAAGRQEVWMLPADVILNTRRAYSTSSTTATGYSASLGPPEGRYIAPANNGSCIQIRPGDCAPRSVLIRAPWFMRFDIGVTKRFPIRGAMNIEVRGDVLNLFDNINFNPVANPGTGATIFQVTSAYQDTSNTYDPGGRLGQIMIRFNW